MSFSSGPNSDKTTAFIPCFTSPTPPPNDDKHNNQIDCLKRKWKLWLSKLKSQQLKTERMSSFVGVRNGVAQLFIDGDFVDSKSHDRIEVFNPATEQV